MDNNIYHTTYFDVSGSIYQAYDIIRKRMITQTGVLSVLSFLLFPLIGSVNPQQWINLFYGTNRLYLLIIVIIWVMFISQIYCFVSKWDKRQIEKQLELLAIPKELFEAAMEKGRIFMRKGHTDSMFVSGEYCIIGGRGQYRVVRSQDIYKLGITSVTVGNRKNNHTEYRLNCLMRNGTKYTLSMPQEQALEVASYLKIVMEHF
jgi:hypothetical protein